MLRGGMEGSDGAALTPTLLLPATMLPNGHIQLGGVEMPVWMAKDALARVWEMCGDVPADVAGRIRCREHLDRVFSAASVVDVRDMQTGVVGRFPAIRDGRRLVVRLGDSVTATLLDEGERWRGFGVQHRDDPIFGVVGEVMRPFVRFSARGDVAKLIREKA